MLNIHANKTPKWSLTNFRYELHVLLELAQLLRGGSGKGVVAEGAAVEVEVGDVRVWVGEGDGDVAQHHRARHLLVERGTLDSLHRAGTLQVSYKSEQVKMWYVGYFYAGICAPLTIKTSKLWCKTHADVEDGVLVVYGEGYEQQHEPHVAAVLLVREAECPERHGDDEWGLARCGARVIRCPDLAITDTSGGN